MTERPLVSIIVTSHTAERIKDIFGLLDSVKLQTYPNAETIFIAERSVELYERVREYGEIKGIPNIKVLFNEGVPGLSAARNMGVRCAKADIMGFTDDDAVLFPDWVEQVVRTLGDDSIIGVTGPALPLWEDASMAWYPEEFYWLVSCTAWCGWDEVREVRNAWGMNMAFRREAFELSGLFLNEFGYHKGFMAEDNEFSLRARAKTGKRIMYIPNMKVRHRVYRYRLSPAFIKERAYWIGYSRRMMGRLYPEADGNRGLLSQERQLLGRIFTRLLPDILGGFFRDPVIAWRKLLLTVTALYFVALGYFSGKQPQAHPPS